MGSRNFGVDSFIHSIACPAIASSRLTDHLVIDILGARNHRGHHPVVEHPAAQLLATRGNRWRNVIAV